ncbi:hypothetical protein EGM51_10150 [Verrucomicrobia bacterium S94]|nr:hypothetical protein EGM51_10150 [Verrucomicrobia bacterium S94]
MNDEQLNELIEESIALELNAAALYKIFSEAIPADAAFWWQLHLEEKSHAILIRAARDSFLKSGLFPQNLIAGSTEELKTSNRKLQESIIGFSTAPPPEKAPFMQHCLSNRKSANCITAGLCKKMLRIQLKRFSKNLIVMTSNTKDVSANASKRSVAKPDRPVTPCSVPEPFSIT